ncbi:hypothetical protein Cs7R123_05680 [Catellatospora sp. TT07R-123]|uniref:bifunctional lysylphosphatidylglycerol flippase/synthetase MprF n=1 Tax=Catellatospora sp. TT07R-123 TaxID=2733863 RepID=UPI001B192BA6|nr:DUF2156 domain-containing protein [Catellatospora sp. TT07R-123]GHJ43226.1 hypothetical protein Cs7R123_05680 [Catellatospora sp. TT07R-123]
MLSTREELEAYSDHPSGFLALNSGNQYYRHPGTRGVISYRESGRYLVVFGGVTAPPGADHDGLLDGFIAYAAGRRRRIVAIQVPLADAPSYAERGFTVNQVGASYARSLDKFSLGGAKYMRLRNKISRAVRAGLEVSEVDLAGAQAELDAVDRPWLKAKGVLVKEITFLIGERTGEYAKDRRLFVGRLDGQTIGYITYSPVYGSRPGWLHDLTRRHPDAPPGVMETINSTAITALRAEGCAWLHLGFTPFVGLDPGHALPGGSRLVDRIVTFLSRHGEHVYPAQSQLAYKEKWGVDVVLPEYVAFQGSPRPGAVWRLLRVTNSI